MEESVPPSAMHVTQCATQEDGGMVGSVTQVILILSILSKSSSIVPANSILQQNLEMSKADFLLFQI